MNSERDFTSREINDVARAMNAAFKDRDMDGLLILDRMTRRMSINKQVAAKLRKINESKQEDNQ